MSGTDPTAVRSAAARLAAGELVAFPTETVYGLGARADDDRAVHRIFELKGRPADHPLIVHIESIEQLPIFVAATSTAARRLIEQFWPGPLTIILPRRAGIAESAAGRHATLAVRSPSHPAARALLAEAAAMGVAGIAAPSANRFGRLSPTRAEHVLEEFGDRLLILDGGPCDVGIESAIVDCSSEIPRLLRPGSIDRRALEAALGESLHASVAESPRAPGTLESHYAPTARLRLLTRSALLAAMAAPPPSAPTAIYARTLRAPAPEGFILRGMPDSATDAARDLFAALHELDRAGAAEIWVEAPPHDAAWDGVRDRLRRAAS